MIGCPHVLASLPAAMSQRIDVLSPESSLSELSRAWTFLREGGGYSVYRIAFTDGAAYVGITARPVIARIEEHFGATGPQGSPDFSDMPISDRFRSGLGAMAIVERLNAGIGCTVDVLASGLDRSGAMHRETAEIAALEKPLNAAGPVRGWRDPLDLDLAKTVESIMRRYGR